jgi:hypothetical protein
MILNISYNDPNIKKAINLNVGKEFDIITKIKLRGIGSKRMVIQNASPDINNIITLQNSIPYCYIELRPQGVIIHFRSILETYGWIVPFHLLSIFQNGANLTIHGAGSFMNLAGLNGAPADGAFVRKILERKTFHFQPPPEFSVK